jgi:hypothetical protein
MDEPGGRKAPFLLTVNRKTMKITNCKFLKPFNINAIVLYPFILYCDSSPSERIISHEQIHINQIKTDGVLKFYIRYLLEYGKGRWQGLSHYEAYRNISYEKEAYSKEVQMIARNTH